MPQAQDEAGNIWEVDAQGNAVRLIRPAGVGQIIPDQAAQYDAPIAAANAANAGATAQVNTATVQAQINEAIANATRAQRAGKTEGLPEGLMWNESGTEAIPIPGYTEKPSATEVEAAEKKEGQERKTAVVRSIMAEVLSQYNQSIRGQPLSRAFGATEKIGFLPSNEAFTSTAMGMLGLIRPIIAQSAREGDSDKEMEAFLSYIPNAGDSDRTIEAKLRNLERLISGAVDGKLPSQMLSSSGGVTGQSETPVVDAALGVSGPGTPDGSPPRQMIPGTGGTSVMRPAEGETYSTPEDVAVANAINEVYRSGGGVKEMIAASQRFNRPVSLQQASEWQQAINYRDGTGEYEGRPGGFSPVNTPESGRRNLAEQVWGGVAASGPGTMAINMADQWAGGGGLDEIAGFVNSRIRGTDYDTETAYADLGKQALNSERPGWALAGSILGAGSQSYGLGRTFPGAASALTRGPVGIAGTGAGYGALSGSLESNEDRLGGGVVGGALGAAGGLAGGYVAAPAMDAISRTGAFQRAARALGRDINVPAFAPGERALPAIDEIANVRTNLQDAERLGLPYALADADPKLRMLAGSVSRKSPAARELAETTFEPRARGQAERAYEAIDTQLAPVVDLGRRKGDLLEAGRIEAAPFYQSAYRQGSTQRNLADLTRPGRDPELEDLLSTPTGQEAMRRAERIAADSQVGTEMTGLQASGRGVRFVESPNLRTLDLVKRGIDDVLEGYRNPVTRRLELDEAGRAIEGFRKRFVEAVDKRFPIYKEARGAFEPFAKRAEALDVGYGLADPKIRPRDLPSITGQFDEARMSEARSGFATRLSDQVNDTSLSGNPFERIYGTPARQEKIDTIFPEGSANLRRIYDLERDMTKTMRETLGGSPTAARIAADQMFDSPMGMAVDAGAQLATGGGFSPGTAFKVASQVLGDNWRLGASRKRAEAIAPVLFNTNPRLTLDYIGDLAGRQAADRDRTRTFRRYGGLFGATAAPAVAGSLVVPVG